MTFWIILILVLAALLIAGIDRLMAQLGVRPAQPEDNQAGLPQLASRIERWAARRGRQMASPESQDAPADDANAHRDEQNS